MNVSSARASSSLRQRPAAANGVGSEPRTPASGAVADDESLGKGHALKSSGAEGAAGGPTAREEDIPFRTKVDRWLETHESAMPWIVFLVALFTRFYRLDSPPGVSFDESHFGRFTNQYMARTYFFDIHPPLGKLVFWAVGQLVGYNSPDPSTRPYLGLETDCRYETIGEEYHPACKFMWLRTVSALHSSLTVLLMYLIGRRWSSSVWGGLLAGGLMNFDMLNLIEGRLILTDAQLIFWCVFSLYTAIKWWDRLNEDSEAEEAEGEGRLTDARRMTWGERVRWCVWVGLVCGNAFSVKMTGLATPAMVGLESALGIWFLKRGARYLDLLMVLLSGVAVYIFYFAVHFWILTRHGDGDEEFMSVQFQSTLLENRHYDPNAVWEGFWHTLVSLNVRMVVHNANILDPHPWQSKWHEWILNQRGVSYYGKDFLHTYTRHQYLLGNHAIHWSVIVAIAALAPLGMAYLRNRSVPALQMWRYKPFFAQVTFCLAVYCLNLAPYVGVARSTFIYHYMPALVYGELIVARVLEQLAGPKWTPAVAKAYLLLIGAVWLYFSPWIYAFALTNDGHARRRWLPRWD